MLLPSSIREYNDRLKFLREELPRHFREMGIETEVEKHLRLVSDIQKFRSEIAYVSDQVKRKTPTTYHIYWDGEWVCRFNSLHPKEKVLLAFWSGLWGLVQDDKVQITRQEMEMAEAIEKEVKREKLEKKRRRKQELLDKPLDPIVKEAVAGIEGL